MPDVASILVFVQATLEEHLNEAESLHSLVLPQTKWEEMME